MRVWITRTRPGADRTAARLRALGHEPVVQPVLEVRPFPGTPDLSGVKAMAFTSVNGVEAFAARSAERRAPVFAVGRATALAAVAAGFSDVRSANGDVRALAALILTRPEIVDVLLATGRPRAGDLAGALAAAGRRVRVAELYETVPVDVQAPGDVDAVLAHSPHAARVLAGGGVLDVPHLCLSAAVAAPLAGRAVRVAARPDDASLLALLPEVSQAG